jgi:hypothetical protein
MWKKKRYIEIEMTPIEKITLYETSIFGRTKKTQIKDYYWMNGKLVFNYGPYNELEIKHIFSYEFFYEMQKLAAEINQDLLSDILVYLQEDLAEHDIFLRQRNANGQIIDDDFEDYPDEDNFLYSESRLSNLSSKLDGPESDTYIVDEKSMDTKLKKLMSSIDEALDNGDKELFQKLSKEYNKIKDEVN